MGRHIAIVAKLYGAWVVIALAVVCGIFAERAPSHLKLVPFNLEVFQLEIPLTDIVLTRAVLSFLVLFVLLRVAFMDYSRLYPKVMEMDVFFDEAGIDRALRRLTPAERRELEIPDDYRAHQRDYYEQLDRELEKVIGEKVIFEEGRADLYSEGETTFVVEKVGGFQRYCLKHSEGRLHHTLERPAKVPLRFMTFFEKRKTEHDYFQPNFLRVSMGKSFVIRPVFNQILAENMKTQGRVFHHAIIGATKIWLYPMPAYGNTLYLADTKGAGLVPVAYAVYR